MHARNEKNVTFKIPSHRFDIALEEDLYEELLRSYGCDNIHQNQRQGQLQIISRIMY